ncbi:hypothetical protein PoB_005689500 [Plakobranchus ocellatus]|uniref:Uncharacterized protein n=1 Tax=Plakobranchus ocellatus TaxID=259542 RepID=A0AAV4CFY5_9GAST|nr:hypothetical protein PoB_005689500 [Plakobranchus ocellatus]
MPGIGHSMGFQAPGRNPLAARQGRHEYGSKHGAAVPPASHTVGGRPGGRRLAYRQGRHPPARKKRATLAMPRGPHRVRAIVVGLELAPLEQGLSRYQSGLTIQRTTNAILMHRDKKIGFGIVSFLDGKVSRQPDVSRTVNNEFALIYAGNLLSRVGTNNRRLCLKARDCLVVDWL